MSIIPDPNNQAEVAVVRLLPQHKRLLADSAIKPEVSAARGYFSATLKSELKQLGFSESQALAPALAIPIWNTAGRLAGYQVRPDQPRVIDGRLLKYETPKNSSPILDVPPDALKGLKDPTEPLVITEGSRKADAAVSLGICCVSVNGVYAWRGRHPHGARATLPDWDDVPLDARPVYLAFDSDAWEKEQVYDALVRQKEMLERRGAKVMVICLPCSTDGGKQGLDDYLAAGHEWTDLLELIPADLPPRPSSRAEPAVAHPYRETPDGLVWDKEVNGGRVPIPLTNFQARIVHKVIVDDGAEQQRFLEVKAVHRQRESSMLVPADQFDSLAWVNRYLDSDALTYPGTTTKDQTRFAIRLLSGPVPERRVYSHTGWREVELGRWIFLHAGGAVGLREGEQVELQLPQPLQQFILPPPPLGAELGEAVRASLGLLDLAPHAVSFPLFSSIYRAPLGGADVSVYCVGRTGVFKTEAVALAQQHFGRELDARNVPAHWSSTDNYIEDLAFHGKDVLLIVDDFVGTGSAADVQRLHAKAERVFRGQGNRSGRGRLRSDGTARPQKPPRGLLVASGEDVPTGQSLRARLFIVEIAPDDIDPAQLTQRQREAAAGLYAAAMAAYIAWLQPRYGSIRAQLPDVLERLRSQAADSGQHRRTPQNVVSLALGYGTFLQFAEETGVLTAEEADAIWRRGWKALRESAARQSTYQWSSDPPQRFLELISAGIASGRAHLATKSGGAPGNSEAWGWRSDTFGEKACGERIGWIEGEDVYLLSAPALKVARSLGGDGADGLQITATTLHKRLKERRLLRSTDPNRGVLTVRITAEKSRREVLHLAVASLIGEESDQTDQSDRSADHAARSGTEEATPGRIFWSEFNAHQLEPDQKIRPESEFAVPGSIPSGQDGRDGQVSDLGSGPDAEAAFAGAASPLSHEDMEGALTDDVAEPSGPFLGPASAPDAVITPAEASPRELEAAAQPAQEVASTVPHGWDQGVL